MSRLDQSSQALLRNYIEQATHDAYLNYEADPNRDDSDGVFVRIRGSSQAILEAVRTGNQEGLIVLLDESTPPRDAQGRYVTHWFLDDTST